MKVTIALKDRQLLAYMARLERDAPKMANTVAQTLAAIGKEYARDIITVAIYATPERGGYRRTRQLIRSIYAQVTHAQKGRGARVTIGASAGYAAYNEFGTYDGYQLAGGAQAPTNIIAEARKAKSDLIVLEYGDVQRGLEPRPFLIPALVMLEREAPDLIIRAYRRFARG